MTEWVVQQGDEIDGENWRRLVEANADANIFHTCALLACLHKTRDLVPHTYGAVNVRTGELGALMVATQVKLFGPPAERFTSRAVVYGGLLCADPAALATLLPVYEAGMRRRVLFTEIRNIRDASAFDAPLQAAGYRYEPHLNYLLDLSLGTEALRQRISRGARKNIRRTLEQGVAIRLVTDRSDLDVFYGLISTTYKRARVPVFRREVFQAVWADLVPQGMACFWVLSAAGRDLAARVVLFHKKVAYDWYAGSVSPMPRGFYPNETLVWTALEEAARRGCTSFDFGGAGRPGEPYGVREFKSKFKGQLVEYGRYRRVHAPALMPVIERTYGVLRRFL